MVKYVEINNGGSIMIFKRMHVRFLLPLLPLLPMILVALALMACETADDNSAEKARACLDNSAKLAAVDPAGASVVARDCEALIANTNTPEAGRVGFGLKLV